ncbi:hypothetical protein [Desulfosporosinus sp.]|uniref:hypothetical protein n=1 Tax=Desulfosporosinus sp. TaxID=157907 RepID=UPI0025C1ACAD|nr:hypothetical protein [Desulfosporosinus sp.]MBC2722340.1 hypothetical protein [Desulfosporosinus sp.]MBC2728626.1 hypothetical protein [Desulfosporosinus sp.]
MNQVELVTALKSLGMPIAYGEFESTPENPSPSPPFITYQFTDDEDLKADNQNYVDIGDYNIELYTDKKDLTIEKLVQDKLKELHLPYSKSEAKIELEELYQVIYRIQLIGG